MHEYGLSPELPVMTHVWRRDDDPETQVVAAKGAPESIAGLCHLPESARKQVLEAAAQLADQGMRVLAVASATFAGTAWPASPHGFDFELLGLVALADPLRDTVPQAVDDCRRAGIRVLMITGDHPGTARAIAHQAGIDGEVVLLGEQIAALDDAALRKAVTTTTVFARVAPQQKLRIVEALKANGEVVAMTGDGVNDAPSLKAAHIGIAMGGRGTDVAREAASLVLLDDDFGTLVQAVRLGRRIYDNLLKAMRFVFAVHVPIAGLTLIPMLVGWPLVFTPMHIAFLEIVIDPVCSIVFEAEDEEPDLMARAPRDPSAPLFSASMMAQSLLQGCVVLLLVGGFYAWLLELGMADEAARASAFIALIMSNIALILANRSLHGRFKTAFRARNHALWGMVVTILALLAATLLFIPVRQLFGFEWPGLPVTSGAVGLGVLSFVLLMAQQRLARRLFDSSRR